MSSAKSAARKRRQAAARRKAANERMVQREQAEKERLDALKSNDSTGTEESEKTEPPEPVNVNDGTEKKQPAPDNTEKKQSTNGNKPVKKQKTDVHADAVNAYRKTVARKERRKKRMRVIIVCVAMIVPVGAASIASLLNLQNGVPTDYNTQTTNSSTSSGSDSGTDVKDMTEEERKALVERYPNLVSNDKEKEEFIKNGTVPENTKSTNDSAGTDGSKSSDTGSMTSDGAKTTTNQNSLSEKK